MVLAHPMKYFPKLGIVALLAVSLAGCGGSAPTVPKNQTPRSIYTSSTDCADAGKLTLDECTKLIEQAIAQHVATAPSYSSLKSCEKTEGPDRCERTDPKSYRPLLAAYLVTFGETKSIEPLYPTSDGKPGFRTLGKDAILDEDDTLAFSKSSVAAYERHLGTTNGDSGYNF